ncbi:metallophosphoesterase [Chryseobacterium carnipullorum]|uniref:Metallophosphoesterase n=1 Tax=Chryseobacterium carnipullorum TaxID=1124835 RepID=A0A376EDJ8_CHRCU|nr:metallophosphoesterase [Chryseobacterium carnipullorum]AZA46899.1 metallophosphoesterase [Chryseobacterium carnipullorum]AZA66256.1 metallophosphoesterase [Chryseobacterium carnipullorum]STD06647.1 putative phosphoesterase [Chryseobacterium carnipullorum]
MKIQYCSDLHLEFPENKKYLLENPIIPTAEILVLAGDIIPFAILDQHQEFFDYLSDHFEMVFWIPGNHEYYHSDIHQRTGSFEEKIRENVILLNNKVKSFGETKLIFSTLWSYISPQNKFEIQQSLNDFRLIKNAGKAFDTKVYTNLFFDNFNFLKTAILEEKSFKKVIVTHHVPTMLNYPPQYKGSAINQAFATELSEFIEENELDYWLYGHHHYNSEIFEIGKTKLLTNQLGYVRSNEHLGYRNNAIFDIQYLG